jgi:hypothetical protein
LSIFIVVNIPNLRSDEVEIVETNDAPPPIPDTPNRIPYATPPIHEEDDDISCNQKCNTFYYSRYMGGNTRLIYNLLQYIPKMKIFMGLLLIDFDKTKTFDSLSCVYIPNTFGRNITK